MCEICHGSENEYHGEQVRSCGEEGEGESSHRPKRHLMSWAEEGEGGGDVGGVWVSG